MNIKITILILGCSIAVAGNSQDPAFQECEPGKKWSGITLQYYQVGTSYKGGLKKIKSHFFTIKNSLDGRNESGYLTLRFMVNCRGDVGKIETLACTFDFNPKEFNSHLCNQLVDRLYELGPWQAGKTADGVAVDSEKFLTFIFKNGVLTDIVPK